MKRTRRIAADTSGLDVNNMCSHGAEETLHTYLRRHFEKVLKRRAEQEGADVEFLIDTPPTERSSS